VRKAFAASRKKPGVRGLQSAAMNIDAGFIAHNLTARCGFSEAPVKSAKLGLAAGGK